MHKLYRDSICEFVQMFDVIHSVMCMYNTYIYAGLKYIIRLSLLVLGWVLVWDWDGAG